MSSHIIFVISFCLAACIISLYTLVILSVFLFIILIKLKEGIFLKTQNTTLITLTLGLGALIGTLNITMFNVALPIMMTYFQTSLATVQWLTSGYMLAAGMIIPTAGFLGKRFGYKRLFCFILFCVLLLSILGAFAWCIEALIVVRFFFGLTGGLLSPLSLAMLYQVMPAGQQAKAASTWGMANIMGGMLPACLSGVILSIANWKFLLLFNIPFALLTLLLSIKLLPKDTQTEADKLDVPGLLFTSLGSLVLLVSFSNLSNWGLSVQLLVGVAIGFSFLFAYFITSRHKTNALLNLRVLKYPRYVAALIASGINVIAIYMITFLMPLFLQSGLGVSPLMTGIIMLPASLFSIFAMPVATKLYPKMGERLLIVLGIVILLIGSAPFLIATPATPVLFIALAMCVRSCGMGAINLVSTNAQMSDIPPELSGYASSLTNWLHQILNAMTVGIAGNIADLRIQQFGASNPDSLALAYTSTTNLMMMASCLLLVAIIPIAMKFFRSKAEMRSV